jgi:hypothetical protein
MERQEKEIVKIQKLLSDAESMWKELPRNTDLQSANNQTLKAIESAKEGLKENDEKSKYQHPTNNVYAHHQPINVPTAGAQAFLMDYT